MIDLSSLETLYDQTAGDDLPLPDELRRLYGSLRFPAAGGRPYVIANFVTTLDGVTSLGLPGKSGGGPISGESQHDRAVMGLLRSVSDAVIVGAGTLRSVPRHVWTPEHVLPSLAAEYRELRASLGKHGQPLNVIVTASGDIDPAMPVFHRDDVPVLITTTQRGADRLAESSPSMPSSVRVVAIGNQGSLTAAAVLAAVADVVDSRIVLLEGGPRLMGDFFAERRLDELFLTLAPQVAGREGSDERPGLVTGRNFAPDDPIWGKVASVKRAGEHLFLRYAFAAEP